MSHGKTVLMLNPCDCPYFCVQVCLAGLYDILKGHLHPSEEWKVFSKLRNVSSRCSLRSRCREPVIQTFHRAPSPTGSLRAKDSALSKTSTAVGSRRFCTACGGLVAAGKTWLWPLRDLPLQAPGAYQLVSELGRVKFEAITFGLESRASALQAGDPLIYQDKEGQPLASLQGGVTRSLECISHIILPTPEKCTYKFEELSLNPKKHTQPGWCCTSLTLRLTEGWEVNIGETKA